MNIPSNSWPEATAISVVSLSTAFVLSPWPWTSEAPWAIVTAVFSAFAAVGTVWAVVVALSRNNQTDRIQAKQDIERASLFAASIEVRLGRYMESLQTAETIGLFALENRFSMFKERLEAAAHDITTEELVNLIPIGEGTAHRIARGLGKVTALRYSVEAAHNRGVAVSDSQTTLFAFELGRAREYLSVSHIQCVEVADKYAKEPTTEELYGDYEPD